MGSPWSGEGGRGIGGGIVNPIRGGESKAGWALRWEMCLTVIAVLALFSAPAMSQAPTPERDFDWVGPGFVAVRVADVEAAATWYREVFDLAQVNQIDADDGAYNIRLLSGEGLNVELLQQRGAQLAPERPLGLFKMGLFVTDLDAFMRHLSN